MKYQLNNTELNLNQLPVEKVPFIRYGHPSSIVCGSGPAYNKPEGMVIILDTQATLGRAMLYTFPFLPGTSF